MKQKLLQILALCLVLFAATESSAQTLCLGNYDAPTQGEECWDGINDQNAPILFTYQYSGSQVLYLPEQLAELNDKAITSISFKYYSMDNYVTDYTANLKLYLHEVDATEFQKSPDGKKDVWFDFNTLNPIAEQDVTIDFSSQDYSDAEITFDLSSKPYCYNGKTLVVTICTNGNQAIVDGTVPFYWIPSNKEDSYRSLVYGSDDTDFITNQATDKAVSNKWKNAPAVKFTYEDATTPQPELVYTNTYIGGYQDAVDDAFPRFSSTNNDILPLCLNYKYNGIQIIYTAEELASIGYSQITDVTFKYYNDGCFTTYDGTIKMYLNEVDVDKFPINTFNKETWFTFDETKPFSEMNLEKNFISSYSAVDSISFKFKDNPFVYNSKNLVVTFVCEANTTIDSGEYIGFYKYDAGLGKNLIYANDNLDFLTAKGTEGTIGYQTGEGHPVVKFTHIPATSGVEQTTIVAEHVVTTQSGAIVLNLSKDAMAQVYDISGKMIFASNLTEGQHSVYVQRGIYIVKIGNETHKVCVLN